MTRPTNTAPLEETIALLTAAVDAIEETIAVCSATRDAQGAYVGASIRYANRFARERWLGPGTTLDAIVGQDLYAVARHTTTLFDHHRRVVETGEPFLGIVEVPHAHGRRWLDLHLVRLGDGFAITSRDVTDQQLAREALEEARERYRAELQTSEERLMDVISGIDAIVTLEDELRNESWVSPQAERILGFPPERLADVGFWKSRVHPEDAAWVHPIWDNETDEYELEYRMLAADDRVVWLRERVVHQIDRTRGLDRWFGVASDVTERKTLEGQLEQSRRIESLGRLAAGVAHDFNNVLYGISILASYLARDLDGGPGADEAHQIAEAVDRGSALTRQLLTFARGGGGSAERTNVSSVVSGVASMIELLLGSGVSLELEATAEPHIALVDRNGLEQALVNLATNARDAMPKGGRLSFRTENVELEAAAAGALDVEPGRYVRVSVADTGSGIPPEIAPRIFEPFASTKPVEVGTGLGLSNVYSFVRAARGAISFQSSPEEGTRFTIHLPAVD